MHVKGIGLPFPAEYSSCSNLATSKFKWTTLDSNTVVYIDDSIEHGLLTPAFVGKYGWLCESRQICDSIYSKILNDLPKYKKSFHKIFTCDESLLADPFFVYCPPGSNLPWTKLEEMQLYEKTKSCSMICSPKARTQGHMIRLQVAAQLKNSLDLFGGAHGSQRIGDGSGPTGDWWRSKLPALKEYRFSIVFENAIYDKYYTEKITDCFATGTIPIYWGTRKVSEDFNPDGIIFWDEFKGIDSLTTELYESKLPYVRENLAIVQKLESADDFLFSKIQALSRTND